MRTSISTTICSRSIATTGEMPAADRHGKRRISSTLFARRKVHHLRSHQTRPHRSRNHHGRHARLAHRRERQESARSRRGARRPPGRTSIFKRRTMDLFHRPGARRSASVSRSPAAGGKPEAVVKERGSVGSFSVHGDLLAYTLVDASRSGGTVSQVRRRSRPGSLPI